MSFKYLVPEDIFVSEELLFSKRDVPDARNEKSAACEDLYAIFMLSYIGTIWILLMAQWAIPAIKDWLARKKWEREHADEIKAQKEAAKREELFYKSGIGHFATMIESIVWESQGGYPLNNVWVDLDSDYDGRYSAKPGKDPVCETVEWKELIWRIHAFSNVLNDVTKIKPSDDTESKTKQLIQKHFGTKIRLGKDKSGSLHLEPMKPHTAKFSSDPWFKIYERTSDLEKICAEHDALADIYKKIDVLKKQCVEGDIKSMDDKSLKQHAILLKFIEMIEGMLVEFKKQVDAVIKEMLKFHKNPDLQFESVVDWDGYPGDLDVIGPANFIEPMSFSSGDF